jgi:hypothetical protein
MIFIPPAWPKPPPFKWTELHDAAIVILEKEIALDEDEFEAWLRQRPGAAAIYLFLADGDAIKAQLIDQVLSHPVPASKMPETLAELVDDKGRVPDLNRPIRESVDFDMRHYQRNTLSGIRRPKGA